MKTLICTLLLPFTLLAQEQIKSKANLQQVVVYNNGAQLLHTGKVTVPSGTSEVTIDNISGKLNENSVQVGVSSGVTILSVQFNRDFLHTDVANPALKKLNDSLKFVTSRLVKTKNAKAIEEQTLVMLDENRKSGGTSNGTSVVELAKLTEYYRNKNLEVRNAIATLSETEEKQNQQLTALNSQIAELRNTANQQQGQLVLQLVAKQNTEANYTISYVTPSANWTASYDVKANNISTPLSFVYKAAITQNTGIDWKKVKLALSTGNPSYDISAPELNPWFLSVRPTFKNSLAGKVAGLDIANSTQALQEVVVLRGLAAPQQKQIAPSTVNNFTSVNESQLGVTFEIDIPYDVSSDNKPHTIAFKEYDVPAKYKYYVAPKLSSDAYLLADVTDWEKLNLQAGNANIIFEGTYTGKSYINPANVLDTMSLSLGKDKKVIVSKEKQEDFSSTKLIGSNKKQVFTYLIKIRNTKKEAIELVLKDQYPLSTQSDIEVELLEHSGAEINKETAILSWQLKLAPNETKVIKLSYAVKSPKNRSLAGL